MHRAERILSSDTVFLAFDGRGERRLSPSAMTPTGIWKIVQHYATALGLAHLKPHDFRRFLGIPAWPRRISAWPRRR